MRALLAAGEYTAQRAALLREMQLADRDSDPAASAEHPWIGIYQRGGRQALSAYLGTEKEQEYGQLEETLRRFHAGDGTLWLRRLGRSAEDLWYEEKDLSGVSVLILEWTHGNSGLFAGVDIPILLASTPAETRAYRLARGRDANADTAFITMVLELEQAKLEARAGSSRIIVSKDCEIVSLAEYRRRMDAGR